ncbi:MAG: hypothetical protein ACRD28_11240 [Acidobacteriaceae bacterium]
MKIKRVASAVLITAMIGMGAAFAPLAMGQNQSTAGQGQLVVTVKSRGSKSSQPIPQSDVAVKLDGHPADIVNWTPLNGRDGELQLVFLFDESARSYLALQIPTLTKFMESLPPSAAIAVAYMGNGRAIMAQTLTTDHALAAKSLRVTNGIPGISASPYFCLSDLAKHWPSQAKARRVVLMVTNGEDPYYRSPDLQDPYVAAAIEDSQKAGLLVYSIYFADRGRMNRGYGIIEGQNYLVRVADETGGESYMIGFTSPVSFEPFLKQFKESLDHQYLLTVAGEKTGLDRVQVKASGVKLAYPKAVYIGKQ